MNIEELEGKEVTILNTQSTFVNIQTGTTILKVNFKGKVEFHLIKNTSGTLLLSHKSPLLIDHNEPWIEVFINSRPSDPDLLLSNIKSTIDAKTEGKRNWQNYVTKDSNFRFENFLRNIKEGNGLLLYAPVSIAKEVELVCKSHGVLTKSFNYSEETDSKKLLSIGINYVIAKDFVISPGSA